MSDNPSAEVIPFGKYKGATVAELLARDPAYAQWLLGQEWLADRFAKLHAAILTRGAAPDDTPEHNAFQARFLDPHFCIAFLLAVGWRTLKDEPPKVVEAVRTLRTDGSAFQVRFEVSVEFEWYGIDVVLSCAWHWDNQEKDDDAGYKIVEDFTHVWNKGVRIEVKPSLGDDFPSVMRQMQRLRCRYLVIQTYTGRGVSLQDLRKMFAANDLRLVMLQEIEAELANARTIPTAR